MVSPFRPIILIISKHQSLYGSVSGCWVTARALSPRAHPVADHVIAVTVTDVSTRRAKWDPWLWIFIDWLRLSGCYVSISRPHLCFVGTALIFLVVFYRQTSSLTCGLAGSGFCCCRRLLFSCSSPTLCSPVRVFFFFKSNSGRRL